MSLRSVILSLTAFAMATAPVAAAAAPAGNPASSLSVVSARAGTPAGQQSDLMGGGFFGIAILAGIAAIIIIAIVNDEEDDPTSP